MNCLMKKTQQAGILFSMLMGLQKPVSFVVRLDENTPCARNGVFVFTYPEIIGFNCFWQLQRTQRAILIDQV